jgi:hypothetical protein
VVEDKVWIMSGKHSKNNTMTKVDASLTIISEVERTAFLSASTQDQAWKLVEMALATVSVGSIGDTNSDWYTKSHNQLYIVLSNARIMNFAKPGAKTSTWKSEAVLVLNSLELVPPEAEAGVISFEFILMPKSAIDAPASSRAAAGGTSMSFPSVYEFAIKEQIAKEITFFIANKHIVDRTTFANFVLIEGHDTTENKARIANFITQIAATHRVALSHELEGSNKFNVQMLRAR